MIFEKGRRRTRKREWRWSEQCIEEMKEMKYLGYILQKNEEEKKHIEYEER